MPTGPSRASNFSLIWVSRLKALHRAALPFGSQAAAADLKSSLQYSRFFPLSILKKSLPAEAKSFKEFVLQPEPTNQADGRAQGRKWPLLCRAALRSCFPTAQRLTCSVLPAMQASREQEEVLQTSSLVTNTAFASAHCSRILYINGLSLIVPLKQQQLCFYQLFSPKVVKIEPRFLPNP